VSLFDQLTRRDFLRRGAAAGVFLSLPASLYRNALNAADPPSEKIRIGCVGVGGQGNSNLGHVLKNVIAVCDVDKTHLAAAKGKVEKANGKCAEYADYRKLLDNKDVDAVVVSTPDHWHTLVTVSACLADKDVYCEKPLTLTVVEGRVIVNAARKRKRIVQTGSQQRSEYGGKFRQACELVRSGRLGKLKTVKVGIPGVNYKERPNDSGPPDLDFDFWLGPAPKVEYNKNHVHYNFRFFWDYSGGQMTNFGAHDLDIAQWALDMDNSGPVEISGKGTFNKDKLYEVTQTCEVTYKYANGVTVLLGQGVSGIKGGVTFEGEKGTIHVDRGSLTSEPGEIVKQPIGESDVHLHPSGSHHGNWLECIKTRKLPICDAEIGHRSATVCHLGNIAIRIGHTIKWDPAKEEIVGDAEAAKMLSRPSRAPWKLPEV
jgi:predicted dehydrogenase